MSKRKSIPCVLEAAKKRINAFINYKWSAAFIAALLFSVMLITYSFAHEYSFFTDVPRFFFLTLQFYLIDFRVGFVSRALVGHIISLFSSEVSVYFIIRLTRFIVILTLALQSCLAGIAFKKAYQKRMPIVCLLCVFFAVSPITVMPNIIYFGVLDPYNLLLIIFYLFISDTKAAYILTPLICFTGIILHYQFVLAYLTAIFSVEIYYICKNKKGRKLRTAIFCITALGSAALTVYLMFFSKYGTKMNAEGLNALMAEKFKEASVMQLYEDYFTYYIYGDYMNVNYSNPLDFIKFLLTYSLERVNKASLLRYAAALLPFFGALEYLWIRAFRSAKKEKKLPYFVFMLQPLVLIAALICSTDTPRWAGASLVSNFALLFTALKNGDIKPPQTSKKASGLLISAAFFAAAAISFLLMVIEFKSVLV